MPTHVVKDRVVQRLLEAEKALKLAKGIHQVRLVMDVAAAQEVFAKRQKLGETIIGYAHALKVHALARLADLLKELPKATGKAGPGRGKAGTKAGQAFTDAPTLADLGIDRKTSSIAQQLAGLPSKTREAIAQREKTITQARRKKKAQDVQKAVSLPDAKHRVLYADPPWPYNDKADTGAIQAGGHSRHYPPMTIAQLCGLPIQARGMWPVSRPHVSCALARFVSAFVIASIRPSVITNDELEAARTGNWFLENDPAIARLDKLSRNEDVENLSDDPY